MQSFRNPSHGALHHRSRTFPQYLLTLLCGCPSFLPFHSQTLIFSLSLLQTAESWLIFSVLSLCVPLPYHSDSPPADISRVFVH